MDTKCLMTDVYLNCVRAGVKCEEDVCYYKWNNVYNQSNVVVNNNI